MFRTLQATRWAFIGCLMVGTSTAADYDPLRIEEEVRQNGRVVDLTVQDAARHREIPLRVYLPGLPSQPAPVVLFSHGLGGSRENNRYLGEHWSARGYVAVFMQHAGSDSSVWRDLQAGRRLQALNEAASLQNFQLRTADVSVVLDQLEQWNTQRGHDLFGRLDLERIGMSGHSFGALTTQAVSGQWFPLLVGQRYTDPRIKAAVAFSPSAPSRGDAARSFGSVSIPWMLMTGTHDVSMIGNADVESRLNVFPHLPVDIDRYELVFDRGEHSAFSDRALPGDRLPRQPHHHPAILALSTAFWDAHLRGDRDAWNWLHGDGPRSLLIEQDRWRAIRSGERLRSPEP